MLRSVHHAQLTVPKGAESDARRFYCDVLGLVEIDKPEVLRPRGGFWLQLGAFQIHIGEEEGVDRRRTKAHLAFEVEDLAKVREALCALGLEVKDGIPIPGMDRFECRDPFGNRIEFLQRTG